MPPTTAIPSIPNSRSLPCMAAALGMGGAGADLFAIECIASVFTTSNGYVAFGGLTMAADIAT